MKRIIAILSSFVAVFLFVTVVKAGDGFDQYGYNRTARIFNGTGSSWCLEQGALADCLGIYSPDKLVMKWNAEWDRGNDEGWANPPYAAWENNEWNGMKGGSGAVWKYKIVWVGDYLADLSLVPDGEVMVSGDSLLSLWIKEKIHLLDLVIFGLLMQAPLVMVLIKHNATHQNKIDGLLFLFRFC